MGTAKTAPSCEWLSPFDDGADHSIILPPHRYQFFGVLDVELLAAV
jgi:hypothetical protein